MKRNILFSAIVGLVTLTLAACDPNAPEAPIPDSFPKKHLIEEFTGQGCGYCPYGMDCIHNYITNDTNWILVLHHDGYSADNFTVKGSSTITRALKVDGAPSISINRAKTKFKNENGAQQSLVVFHPGYLESTLKSQFNDSTYASVRIKNSYDASSRELNILVSGELCNQEHPDLYLTVLIKESGMIDYQMDYVKTYEGWQEFRHANAVRVFLTEAKGDELLVNNQRYSERFTVTLDAQWVPENCMVVAFLTEAFQPVVQAEQCPVVVGTQGGADIVHGGITPVPVDDFYPEPSATDGPSAFSGNEAEEMSTAFAHYFPYPSYGFNYWRITAYNTNASVQVNNSACMPFCYLYLFTESSQTTIPTGTYELNQSMQPGTAWAGFRDDSNFSLNGSMFYFINKAYFNQGYLYAPIQWFVADGTLTITEEGWEVTGHTANGADIHLIGTTPIANKGRGSAPAKAPRKEERGIQPIIL